MDFDLTVSYNKETDMIEIIFEPQNDIKNIQNQIVLQRVLYKPFISLLLATGQQMQKDKIDVGFDIEDGEEND